jgi:hypothetical protein
VVQQLLHFHLERAQRLAHLHMRNPPSAHGRSGIEYSQCHLVLSTLSRARQRGVHQLSAQ